jgi:long-chain acyl-CoA synthetase
MLCDHPQVQEAVVFPIPDAKRGSVIGAAVVLRPGPKIGEKELLNFVRPNLANFKVPERIAIRDSLPRTSTGKVIKDPSVLLSN